jgi:hypothetical protein
MSIPFRSFIRSGCRLGLGLGFVLGATLASSQTVFLSSLGQSPAGYSDVSFSTTESYHRAVGQAFTVGGSDVILDNITIKIATTGSGTGFSVGLYSHNSLSTIPGSLIETLSGETAPTAIGNYSYTPGGSTLLLANTTYWWVATVPSGVDSNFSINRIPLGSVSANGGWSALQSYGTNMTGTAFDNWSGIGGRTVEFSVSATTVPEPAAAVLFAGLAALGLAVSRRARRSDRRIGR